MLLDHYSGHHYRELDASISLATLLTCLLSELYGRQIIFFITYGVLTVFNAGTAVSQNIATVLVLRFIGGSFGSSPLTNAGGVIADMFGPDKRGLAMALFSAAPFMGPVVSLQLIQLDILNSLISHDSSVPLLAAL